MEDKCTAIARAALDIRAVKLQPDAPFTWASGYRMPVYNDNRLFLFYPQYRTLIRDAFAERIEAASIPCDVIAGTPTAGIPHAALLAEKLGKPFIYPRKQQKGHGMQNRIEGIRHDGMIAGKRVLMIEDLISTGKSSVAALETVREAGAEVDTCLSIFTYGFDKAEEAFRNAGAAYRSLIDLDLLISVLEEKHYFTGEQIRLLREWQRSPFTWGERFKKEDM